MQKPLRAFSPVVFLVSATFLQAQATPSIQSANNTASYDPTAIAQGSMFVIFGSSLGPGTLVPATQLPLPNALATTSVTVTSGNTTLSCPMFYTSFGQVVAVMPSNTPLGAATVSVTFNNISSGQFSATVNVVASSVGMFTPDATGLGPGIFTDALTGAHITLANSATSGELLTGWASGVGALAGYDNAVPPAAALVNSPTVQVWVGGQAAQMSYAGRSGCCVAVDQLNFFVPAGVSGCSVPVFVASNGRTSATTTIPISAAGGPCTDSGPTLPSNLLTSAAAGAPLKVGVIVIAPTSTVQPASRQPRYVADQLSAAFHVPVSVEDATRIMQAAEAHNSKALKRALANYSEQWRALSSRARARLAESVGSGQAVEALAMFGTVTSESFAASTISAQIPPAGSCVLPPSPIPLYFYATSVGLDAGASLSLVGAAGSTTLQRKTLGTYQANSINALTSGDIPTGSYTLSGSGHDLTFSVTVNVVGHPTISNKAALAQIDRTQPVTINWTGGTPGQFVMIGGFSSNHNTGLPPQIAAGNRDFVCSEAAEKGTFTVPTYITQALWPTPDGSGAVFISYGPASQPLNIPGLDGAWFIDGSSDEVKHIVFK
jgi:uncharacterized protein (TIGR03437 family)